MDTRHYITITVRMLYVDTRINPRCVAFDLIPHLYYSTQCFTCCKLSHAIRMQAR